MEKIDEYPRHELLSPVAQAKQKYFSTFKSRKDEPYKPTVLYVPNRRALRGRFPVVNVHQKRNGRYVVVEQKPVHTVPAPVNQELERLREIELHSLGSDGEVKYKYVKPPWKFSPKGNLMERSFNREFHEPYLPPISDRRGYKEVKSKVGSLDNYDHAPRGGNRKIPTFKVNWHAEAKVGSLDNIPKKSKSYPNSEIASARSSISDPRSLRFHETGPHYGGKGDSVSFSGYHYTPNTVQEIPFSARTLTAEAKVGSLDNIHHKPQGGHKLRLHFPTNWKSEAKVDSLEKIFHAPSGGDVTIIDMKPKWKALPKIKSHNTDYKQHRSDFKVPHFEADWKNTATSKVNSLSNKDHTPRTNTSKIYKQRLKWKKESKIKQIWENRYQNDDPYDPDYDEDKVIEAKIREMLETDPRYSSRFSEY